MDIILGPPGAGKGTQCNFIKNNLNLEHISAGELLRAKYPEGTKEREELNQGLYVVPALVNSLMEEEIVKYKHKVIIDGYPRSLEQATFIKSFPIGNIYILYSENYSVLLNRVLNRRQCAKCLTIFKQDSVCCGLQAGKRADDNEISFKKRYELFFKNIWQILYELNRPVIFLNCEESEFDLNRKIAAHHHS